VSDLLKQTKDATSYLATQIEGLFTSHKKIPIMPKPMPTTKFGDLWFENHDDGKILDLFLSGFYVPFHLQVTDLRQCFRSREHEWVQFLFRFITQASLIHKKEQLKYLCDLVKNFIDNLPHDEYVCFYTSSDIQSMIHVLELQELSIEDVTKVVEQNILKYLKFFPYAHLGVLSAWTAEKYQYAGGLFGGIWTLLFTM